MKKEEIELIKKFENINKKCWIESVSNSIGSIGLTFEKELGKNTDSMFFPDYKGIEIKCTSRYSRYPLYLFTVAFDGPTFPEINRIIEKYGYYDTDYRDKKVLFTKLNCKELTKLKSNYKLRLDVDEEKEKVFLEVYNLENELIEKKSFVYIRSIYNHLMIKLKTLAIIHASIKRQEKNYFRYYQIDLYELISFEEFINQLKLGVIEVGLIARINKSGKDVGRYRNKNLVFQIKKKNINRIYRLKYHLNKDLEYK